MQPNNVPVKTLSAKLQAAIRATFRGGFKTRRTGRTDNRFRLYTEYSIFSWEFLTFESGGLDIVSPDDFHRSLSIKGFNLQLKVGAPSPL
jgi:hypothetical protein